MVEDYYFVNERKDNYIIAKKDNKQYLVYMYDNRYEKGNVIYFKGVLERLDFSDSFNDSLKKKGINYKINYSEYYLYSNSTYLNDDITNSLLDSKDEANKSYLKLILFNERDSSNEKLYNMFLVYSISYLITISGFHIDLLFNFFKKIHFKIGGIIFVSFYLYLLNFNIASYRAFLSHVFKSINKRFDFCLSSLDIISLIGIVFITLNPSVIFSYSFIFSFTSSLVIEIFKVYKVKRVIINFYVYLVNIPLIMLLNYKLNLLTIFLSIIFSFIVSFIYLFSLIYLFFDKFSLIYKLTMLILEKTFSLIGVFSKPLIFGKPSVVIIVLYYLFLFMYFCFKEARKKNIYLLIIFLVLLVQYSLPYLNSSNSVSFMNVGQGDCTIFILPHSKKAVVIDTGGNINFDVSKKVIVPFLEKNGVNAISYLIISHGDYDHMGGSINLVNNFKVEQVIFNCGEFNELENELMEVLDKKKIVYNSCIEELNVGNSKLYFLQTEQYDNENDNSNVIYTKIGEYKFIFMGDAGIDKEKDILEKYIISNVDVLKVGHHGSKTSSGNKFIKEINPRYSIISVGKNNRYGHPNKEVLNNLGGSKIYRTDQDGSIMFKIKNNKIKIETCSP